mgnify:CR=1 FL=1
MDELRKTGRVTIPTDLDVVPETLEILKKWGADAIRDCDGTDFPQQLKDADARYTPPTIPPARTTHGKGKPGRGTAVLHHDPAFTPPPGAP